MTVAELEAILAKIKNKNMHIVTPSYYNLGINGYYMDMRDDEEVLVLTCLKVQPM